MGAHRLSRRLATRLPIARLETLTLTDQTYQPLLTYQVPANAKRTILETLSLTPDPNVLYRLVIGSSENKLEQFRDKTLKSFTADFPWRKENELLPGFQVAIYARSSTGTSITVSAILTAEEEYEIQGEN